ncbi:MAG TPA: aspartate aminotransferase family protein [Chthonomonadaceae bacterium]|nr:aspartate aminotransferase family protein [Chthonomonadaceae bacterium]
MLTEERVVELCGEGLLAEVVGFETDEVALAAQGASVVTYRGTRYIDFTGGIAVHACGHNHPEVIAAIVEQAGKVMHVSDTMRHAPQLELGRWMRDLFGLLLPGAPWSFLFLNSGSESIDAAAKLALKVTGRTKFVAFEGAFHGRTLFATALSHSKRLHWEAYEGFLVPLRANIHHAPAPRCAKCHACKPTACCVAGLERLLNEMGGDVAAVVFEPQQGEGGYVPMAPAAAQRIRELTSQRGILLIADEIQTGWGRTGRWFGFEHLGIAPDIVVFGKAVGGGLPLAGVAARQEMMALWQPGEHGTTFGGNPVACAAGLAALRIIEREGLIERAAHLGEILKARLRPLVGQHGVVDVRGNGLMIGVELRDAAGRPDYARCEAVKRRAREAGLLLLTCGAKIGNPATDNATLRLIPPLNIPEEVLQEGLDIFEAALQEATAKAA